MVLADFRAWLQQAATEAAQPSPEEPEAEPLDLHTLLGQFAALRHEVNLQTRATRAQQEQNAETLRRLSEALAAARQVPAAVRSTGGSDPEEAMRPLVKTLVDVYDALLLAGREAQRLRETVLPSLETILVSAERPVERPRGFWSRWLGGREVPAPDAHGGDARQAIGQVQRLLDSLVTGYGMSLRRLERTLQQTGLERMACVGESFDPEQMEVLEVTNDPSRSPGEVIEEVRPGYRWNGRVFRYAQVRVARPSLSEPEA